MTVYDAATRDPDVRDSQFILSSMREWSCGTELLAISTRSQMMSQVLFETSARGKLEPCRGASRQPPAESQKIERGRDYVGRKRIAFPCCFPLKSISRTFNSTMSMSVGSKLQLEPGSWAEFAYDVLIGISVGSTHSLKLIMRWLYNRLILPVLQAFGFKEEQENELEKTLKVVAVGYGRTGTVSRRKVQSAFGREKICLSPFRGKL